MAENKVDVCHLLLNRGADATQCDADRMMPLDYARMKDHPLAVALMTCHEGSVADFIRQRRSVRQISTFFACIMMIFITCPVLKYLLSVKHSSHMVCGIMFVWIQHCSKGFVITPIYNNTEVSWHICLFSSP